MLRRCSITNFFIIGTIGLLLFASTFAATRGASHGPIGMLLHETETLLADFQTQRVLYLCFGAYLVMFIYLRFRELNNFCRPDNPHLWLASALLLGSLVYINHNQPSMQALVFIGTVTLGQGFAILSHLRHVNKRCNISRAFLYIFLIFISCSSLWTLDSGASYEYRGERRWSGPWSDPNVFGLLMGCGVVLAVGTLLLTFSSRRNSSETSISQKLLHLNSKERVLTILSLLAATLAAHGLLKSYSRGAWLGTACGLTYLFWLVSFDSQVKQQNRWFLHLITNRFRVMVISFAMFVLVFWPFRETKWGPPLRILSSINMFDFSCQNRIAAWKAALQIIADHPWLGVGWNNTGVFYQHFYLAPSLSESAAIETNDYLMLGASVGMPSLICFIFYIWLSLTQNRDSTLAKRPLENKSLGDGLKQSGRPENVLVAAAIVLLVGFWFDGGLFKLPTASVFWILWELGST